MTPLLDLLEKTALEAAGSFEIAEADCGRYAQMRYPKWPPMMRFAVKRWQIAGFGQLMVMQTRAMGLMKLATASFMPNEGANVPFLLIDMMAMGRKRTVFVEYYDTTAKGVTAPQLDAVHDRYADLPAYDEKPHWYVGERMGCSLIKGGTAADDARLADMVRDSVQAYFALAAEAGHDPANLTGLAAFADRMVAEGNPSSGTMEKVLGKTGAEAFFREMVMPVKG